LGLRFRLHRSDLPGEPDLVFPKHKTALFVHGCFWHRHPDCVKASTPKTRTDYWQAKFDANLARDSSTVAKLTNLGWQVCVVWECQTKNSELLQSTLLSIIQNLERTHHAGTG